MRFRNLALLGVTAALALSACTSSGDPQATPTNQPSTPLAQSTAAAFPLPTSDWEQGDNTEQALLNATLYLDGQCLVAVSGPVPTRPPAAVTAVVWPKGFTASEPYDGIVAVANTDGTVVAFSGKGIKVGGGYSATDGDVTSDVISSLEPQCAGKYNDVFVVQDSMTSSDPTPTPSTSLLADLVRKPGQLAGKWFATELYGKDVKPRTDAKIPVPYLVFTNDPAQAPNPTNWSTDDECNFTGGRYTVTPDRGVFDAKDGVTTLVGCPPGWAMHDANVKAVTEADRAFVQLPPITGTAILTLTAKGEIIGVYEAPFIEG